MRRVFFRSSNTIGARWAAAKDARRSRRESWTRFRRRFGNTPTSGIISCLLGQNHDPPLFSLFAPVQLFWVRCGYERFRDAMADGAVESQNMDSGFHADANFENAQAAVARAGTSHLRSAEQFSLATGRSRAD